MICQFVPDSLIAIPVLSLLLVIAVNVNLEDANSRAMKEQLKVFLGEIYLPQNHINIPSDDQFFKNLMNYFYRKYPDELKRMDGLFPAVEECLKINTRKRKLEDADSSDDDMQAQQDRRPPRRRRRRRVGGVGTMFSHVPSSSPPAAASAPAPSNSKPQ